MTFQDYLQGYGVTDPSQLQYRDASAGIGDMSAADQADAGYSSSRFGKPSAGLSGYSTPDGRYIPAGDIYRDGHTVYTIQQGADGKPAFSSHVDAPNLGLKELASTLAFVFGGAYGMDALGGVGGVGGAGMDSAANIGAANALSDGTYAGADWGAMSGAPGAASEGAGGAANGMWDVLPDAASNGGLAGDATASGYDPLYGTQGGDAGATGADAAGSTVSPTDYNYTNQADKLSDTSTASGTAADGTVNAGTGTGGPGANISTLGFNNPVTSWLSGMKPTEIAKLVSTAASLLGGGGAAKAGGAGGGTTADTTTQPFDYGPARYLPPGWRTDRPMYVPGQDAIPEGWFGAGHTTGT